MCPFVVELQLAAHNTQSLVSDDAESHFLKPGPHLLSVWDKLFGPFACTFVELRIAEYTAVACNTSESWIAAHNAQMSMVSDVERHLLQPHGFAAHSTTTEDKVVNASLERICDRRRHSHW